MHSKGRTHPATILFRTTTNTQRGHVSTATGTASNTSTGVTSTLCRKASWSCRRRPMRSPRLVWSLRYFRLRHGRDEEEEEADDDDSAGSGDPSAWSGLALLRQADLSLLFGCEKRRRRWRRPVRTNIESEERRGCGSRMLSCVDRSGSWWW